MVMARACKFCGRSVGMRTAPLGGIRNPVYEVTENLAATHGCVCLVSDEVLVRTVSDLELRFERWKSEVFPDGLPVKGTPAWPDWVGVLRAMDSMRALLAKRGLSPTEDKPVA